MIVWAYESEVHAVHSGYIVYYSISHSLYIPSQFRASLAQLKQSAIRRAARYISRQTPRSLIGSALRNA